MLRFWRSCRVGYIQQLKLLSEQSCARFSSSGNQSEDQKTGGSDISDIISALTEATEVQESLDEGDLETVASAEDDPASDGQFAISQILQASSEVVENEKTDIGASSPDRDSQDERILDIFGEDIPELTSDDPFQYSTGPEASSSGQSKVDYSVLGSQGGPRNAEGFGTLHPFRKFRPGQTYEPEDLTIYSRPSQPTYRQPRASQVPSIEDCLRYADKKNPAFLEQFLSPTGYILHRKVTKLPRELHRFIARQIRVARCMALVPYEARFDNLHIQKLRAAQQQQLKQIRRTEDESVL